MLKQVLIASLAIALTLLFILLQVTTPSTIGPLGILIVFILMYVSALSALTFLLYGASRAVAKFTSSMIVRRPIHPMSLQRAYYFSSVLALAPVMFIGMQSVGEVGVYELLLVILFVAISCVYIAKRTS